MQGGRLTSCKSGKDRTGMAITLEECCFLRNYHHLDSSAFNNALSTMRRYSDFGISNMLAITYDTYSTSYKILLFTVTGQDWKIV